VVVDPLARGTAQLIDAALRLWDRSAAFLWSLAAAGAAVYAILSVGNYFAWDGTPGAFASYGLGVLIWTVVFTAVAIARTVEGRAKRPMYLVGDQVQSSWGPMLLRGGGSGTVFNFRMRVTNLTRGNIRVTVARLLKPHVGKPEVRVETRDPATNMYGEAPPMVPNATRDIHFMFVVDRQLGTPGKPMKAIVTLSDQRGRWCKYTFAKLRGID
jgi:hypothetical protein